jgi:hypothetical protein
MLFVLYGDPFFGNACEAHVIILLMGCAVSFFLFTRTNNNLNLENDRQIATGCCNHLYQNQINDSIHQTNNLITFHCLRVDVITVILLEVANLHAAAALGK